MSSTRALMLLITAMTVASLAHAQDPPQVTYRVDVTAVAPRTAASGSTLRGELFSHLFVDSPADVLRAVPGLVIAQHAGGGRPTST